MSKRSASSKLTLALVATTALGTGLWSLSGDDAAEGSAANLLPNQVWIDRVPESDRDMITHLLVLDHPRARNFGLIGHSSQWRHHLEVMRWRLDGERLGLVFPQDRRQAKLKARTWECGGEAPEPFDLCLELSNGDRKLRMFSHHDWVVEPQGSLHDSMAELAEAHPELASLREATVPEAFEVEIDEDDLRVDANWLP